MGNNSVRPPLDSHNLKAYRLAHAGKHGNVLDSLAVLDEGAFLAGNYTRHTGQSGEINVQIEGCIAKSGNALNDSTARHSALQTVKGGYVFAVEWIRQQTALW